jgi:Cys-rich protein (TIGR01571 family)
MLSCCEDGWKSVVVIKSAMTVVKNTDDFIYVLCTVLALIVGWLCALEINTTCIPSINELQMHGSHTMATSTQWSSGLCDPSCMCVCACVVPCVVFANNVSLMEKNKISPIPVVDACTPPGTSCSKSLCGGILYGVGTAGVYLNSCDPTGGLLTVAQCLPIFVHMQVRGKIRSHYKIDTDCCYSDGCCDGGCDDFCCAMCCYSCALAQESRMLTENQPAETNSSVAKTDVHYPYNLNIPSTMGGPPQDNDK